VALWVATNFRDITLGTAASESILRAFKLIGGISFSGFDNPYTWAIRETYLQIKAYDERST
jgi:hypothetical protein